MLTIPQQRRELLQAAFPYIKSLGWNRQAFEEAARQHTGESGRFTLLFPRAIADTLEEFQKLISDDTQAALAKIDLPPSIHQRIHRITCERFAIIEAYRPVMLRAIEALGSPGDITGNLLEAPVILFRSSHDIWHMCGDTSKGWTYYSKRLTLCAVLSSGLVAWAARPYEREKFDAFLQRRLKDVAVISGALPPCPHQGT